MRDSVGWLACLALTATAFARSYAQAQQTPAFGSHVELVQIDAVVLDHEGRPVTGLKAEDFEVLEEGHARPIVSFEPVAVRASRAEARSLEPETVAHSEAASPEDGRYYVVYFDDVHMSMVNASYARAGLLRFLEKDVRDGDRVTIVAPAAGVWWTARTPWEHRQLPALVPRLKGQFVRRHPLSDGDYGPMREIEFGGPPAQAVYGPNSFYGGNPSLDAQEMYAVTKRRLHESLGALRQSIEALLAFRGRKSLILYSGGFVRPPSMQADFDHVIDAARRANVTIDFVDVNGLDIARDRLETEAAGSGLIAAETGGRSVALNDLEEPMRQAVDESSAYYLLGFEPGPGSKDERRLKVRVKGRKLEVRARKSYFLSEAPHPKDETPTLRDLRSVFDATELPIRVGAFFGEPMKDDVVTTLAVDASPNAEVGRRLTLAVQLRPLRGDKRLDAESEVSLASGAAVIRAALAPGVWQARVVLRDPGSGKAGSALHTFEVPATHGFRVSTPIVTDKLEIDGSPRIELEPAFVATSTLHCRYEVFGAMPDKVTGLPRVTRAYALETGGQAVSENTSAESEGGGQGRILGIYDVPLSSFTPGAYALALHVADEVARRTLDTRARFMIIAP